MKSSKWMLRAALVLLFPLTAAAQKAERTVPAKTDFFKKQLTLTDQAAQQVVMIMDDYKAKIKLIMENKELNDAQKREQTDLLIDEKNTKLKKLLPPDQWAKIIPATELNKAAN